MSELLRVRGVNSRELGKLKSEQQMKEREFFFCLFRVCGGKLKACEKISPWDYVDARIYSPFEVTPLGACIMGLESWDAEDARPAKRPRVGDVETDSLLSTPTKLYCIPITPT